MAVAVILDFSFSSRFQSRYSLSGDMKLAELDLQYGQVNQSMTTRYITVLSGTTSLTRNIDFRNEDDQCPDPPQVRLRNMLQRSRGAQCHNWLKHNGWVNLEDWSHNNHSLGFIPSVFRTIRSRHEEPLCATRTLWAIRPLRKIYWKVP